MIRGLATTALLLAVAACGASAPPPVATGPTLTARPAGPYTSAAFQPQVTFTLPDGWLIASDGAALSRG